MVLKRVLPALAVLAIACGLMVVSIQSAGAATSGGYAATSHSLSTPLGAGTVCGTDQVGKIVGSARVRVTNADPATFLGAISFSASVKLPKGDYDVYVAEPNIADGVVVGCSRTPVKQLTARSSYWTTFVCFTTPFGQGVHDNVQLVIAARGGSQTGFVSPLFAVIIG